LKDRVQSLGSRWLLLVVLISTACTQVGKVTVIVTDYETGEALPGLTVRAGFVSHDGMSAGPDNKFNCVTDSDGRCNGTRCAHHAHLVG